MRKPIYQYTKKQKLGVALLAICIWAFFIGIYWSIVKDVVDGLIISGAGAIGSGVLTMWLVIVNPDYR